MAGFLKFYGNVTRWKPTQMFSEYPTAINVVYDIILNVDLTVIGVAFDTLGYIATSNAGKYELEATGNYIPQVVIFLICLFVFFFQGNV